MELLPQKALLEVSDVMTFGAEKYGDYNWLDEPCLDWTRLQGSLERHLKYWASGEDFDPESGLNHIYHVAANALMLAEYIARGKGKDTRFSNDDN